jgi:CcmD family protein
MTWVYAAYAATWAIHMVYLLVLTRGYQRVREEIEDLERR